MSKTIQSIRGMNDVLPDQVCAWQRLEATLQHVAQQFGYQEIRTPLVEQASLFKRSVGVATDIVQKEMYEFTDQNDDQLALRPEGTAACVRACIQHGMIYNQTQKLWYMGPMYRRERPQKGRYRQFFQFGIEAFGFHDHVIEVEQLLLLNQLWQQLQLKDLTLEINHLGSAESRQQYQAALVSYLQQHVAELDADSQQRLTQNPLRILDSKNSQTQEILSKAPMLDDFLLPNELEHYQNIQQILQQLNINFVANPRLVRGLDYYNGLVFEWTTKELGAQSTICAGGRYDGLVQQLGGQSCPAFGFAMGLERILQLMAAQNVASKSNSAKTIHFLCCSQQGLVPALSACAALRHALPELTVVFDAHQFKLKNQLKRAHKAEVPLVVILGQEELEQQKFQLKYMQHRNTESKNLTMRQLIDALTDFYSPNT